MKIEVGESLVCSYLKHVKKCPLVQSNWKVVDSWDSAIDRNSLQKMFDEIKKQFGAEIFKGTKTGSQFIKQGEIDVLGMDAGNNVYAIDLAFHENGLNYTGGSGDRVLKKLLRSYLTMQCYFPNRMQHIYFACPFVRESEVNELEEGIKKLTEQYSDNCDLKWDLLINERFKEEIYDRTIDAAQEHSDTSELFIRSWKLIQLMDKMSMPEQQRKCDTALCQPQSSTPDNQPKLQDTIRKIMRLLLEEKPLPIEEIKKMTDIEYTQREMNLKLSYPLLRNSTHILGKKDSKGRDRYWDGEYGKSPEPGIYYVCSQWGKNYHRHNAEAWGEFLQSLIEKYPDCERNKKLKEYQQELYKIAHPRRNDQ